MNLNYIKSSGNVISEDFCLELLNDNKSNYVKDSSYGIKDINNHIATVFELLRERWEEIRNRVLNREIENSTFRKKWINLFFEFLDFNLTVKKHLTNDAGIDYDIKYLGWNSEDACPVHIVALKQNLDEKDIYSRSKQNKSPQDLLQSFLNTTKNRWAILTNGHKLRILRDYFHSLTKGFLEFDIEGIFESADFEHFKLLYKVLHKSRFENQKEIETDDEKTTNILEKYYELSKENGVKIGNKLREQVKNAIELLGNGFIKNESVDIGNIKKIYSEILNIIYRVLFLLFAEQKGWLPIKNDLYSKTYSITYLRNLSEKGTEYYDSNTDLWEGLKITFKLVSSGFTFPNGDKINSFGGQLFSEEKISILKNCRLTNETLLKSIYELSYFVNDKVKYKINYSRLAIEALGSIYESLLDYEPKIADREIKIGNQVIFMGSFYLDNKSIDRKTTGSYYTDSRLVAQLIDSALVPVINKSLSGKINTSDKEKSILDLKICDMACGSAAFLVAATNKLGYELANIRKGEEELPTEEELRAAKRDVLLNCIYGVDINPMAVELAKFSLWITASMPDLPLSFLDHKIKCGNSLIGATPELIEKGIPPEAFNQLTLDESDICKKYKNIIRKELKQMKGGALQSSLEFIIAEEKTGYNDYEHIISSNQVTIDEVEEIEKEYYEYIGELKNNIKWKLADTWTSAFFIEKTNSESLFLTNEVLLKIKAGETITDEIESIIIKTAQKYQFFHWHLEFPEVFKKGGFDCVLGNPPWEKIKLQEREFFKEIDKNIANLKKNERTKLISDLTDSNTEIKNRFLSEKSKCERQSNYLLNSSLYPLMGKGDINTYMIFTEKYLQLLNKNGRAGIIVPTGISTDDTTKDFFNYLVKNNLLISLYDFQNKKGLFHDVHRDFKFCLLTFTKESNIRDFDFMFFAKQPEDLLDKSRHFSLNSEELLKINPNTGNCPVFKTRRDAEIVKKIYNSCKVLISESENHIDNPFEIKYYTMFHMTNDSSLFISETELSNLNCILKGNIFFNPENKETYLPLYEGKMIDRYNHRFSSIEYSEEIVQGRHDNVHTEISQLKNPHYLVKPRFWVKESDIPVLSKVPDFVSKAFYNLDSNLSFDALILWYIGCLLNTGMESKATEYSNKLKNSMYLPDLLKNSTKYYDLTNSEIDSIENINLETANNVLRTIVTNRRYKYLMGFRDITNSGAERTSVFSIIPYTACGNNLPLIISPRSDIYLLYANLNSIIFDFVSRQKIGGNHLSLFILKQLPVIDDNSYTDSIKKLIKDAVVKLTYVCYDLTEFAFDLGNNCKPYSWNDEERFELMCELDAIYVHLYNLNLDELSYILNTFTSLKNKELDKYGSFKTKETIIKYYNNINININIKKL